MTSENTKQTHPYATGSDMLRWPGRASINKDEEELWKKSDALWEKYTLPESVVCKPLKGRTRRVMIDIKDEHRGDLDTVEWGKQKSYLTWEKEREKLIKGCCGEMIGLHSSKLERKEFQDKYEYPRIPVIFQGLADEWGLQDKWTYEYLRKEYGESRFKCGEDDDGYPLKVKLKHFFRYQNSDGADGARKDDSPLYIFDNGYDDDAVTRQILEEYTPPKLFNEDLFHLVGEEGRPPYRWVLFGPERSGSGLHIDPLGTSAWNTLVRGRKLWVLFPPNADKKLVKAKKMQRKGEDDEPFDYFTKMLPRMLENCSQEVKDSMIQFIQYPGETVYVPSDWWHAVLNLDDTIAVTQNYCSSGNFDIVWRSARKGRKRMAKKWLSKLKEVRPDLYKRAVDLDKVDGYDLEKEIEESDRRQEMKRRRKGLKKKKGTDTE